VSSDLKLTDYVDAITSKAASRLFFLKQLRRADVPPRDLLHFYTTVVRPVLEYACPVWHSGLTIAQSDLLESVQKRGICIVYPDADYLTSLIVAGIDTLCERREVLTAKFFKRQVLASSSLLHSLQLDRRDNDITSSLRNAKPFYSFRARTNRFRKPFLPYCLDKYT